MHQDFVLNDYYFHAVWEKEGLVSLNIAPFDKKEPLFPPSPEKLEEKRVFPFQHLLVKELGAWLSGEAVHFTVPLIPRGTPFQKAIWQALIGVPYGTSCSYSELALRAGYPRAIRAAGTACGANPLIILIPCHRAVRSDGSLGGFSAGLGYKKIFHTIEGIELKGVLKNQLGF